MTTPRSCPNRKKSLRMHNLDEDGVVNLIENKLRSLPNDASQGSVQVVMLSENREVSIIPYGNYTSGKLETHLNCEYLRRLMIGVDGKSLNNEMILYPCIPFEKSNLASAINQLEKVIFKKDMKEADDEMINILNLFLSYLNDFEMTNAIMDQIPRSEEEVIEFIFCTCWAMHLLLTEKYDAIPNLMISDFFVKCDKMKEYLIDKGILNITTFNRFAKLFRDEMYPMFTSAWKTRPIQFKSSLVPKVLESAALAGFKTFAKEQKSRKSTETNTSTEILSKCIGVNSNTLLAIKSSSEYTIDTPLIPLIPQATSFKEKKEKISPLSIGEGSNRLTSVFQNTGYEEVDAASPLPKEVILSSAKGTLRNRPSPYLRTSEIENCHNNLEINHDYYNIPQCKVVGSQRSRSLNLRTSQKYHHKSYIICDINRLKKYTTLGLPGGGNPDNDESKKVKEIRYHESTIQEGSKNVVSGISLSHWPENLHDRCSEQFKTSVPQNYQPEYGLKESILNEWMTDDEESFQSTIAQCLTPQSHNIVDTTSVNAQDHIYANLHAGKSIIQDTVNVVRNSHQTGIQQKIKFLTPRNRLDMCPEMKVEESDHGINETHNIERSMENPRNIDVHDFNTQNSIDNIVDEFRNTQSDAPNIFRTKNVKPKSVRIRTPQSSKGKINLRHDDKPISLVASDTLGSEQIETNHPNIGPLPLTHSAQTPRVKKSQVNTPKKKSIRNVGLMVHSSDKRVEEIQISNPKNERQEILQVECRRVRGLETPKTDQKDFQTIRPKNTGFINIGKNIIRNTDVKLASHGKGFKKLQISGPTTSREPINLKISNSKILGPIKLLPRFEHNSESGNLNASPQNHELNHFQISNSQIFANTIPQTKQIANSTSENFGATSYFDMQAAQAGNDAQIERARNTKSGNFQLENLQIHGHKIQDIDTKISDSQEVELGINPRPGQVKAEVENISNQNNETYHLPNPKPVFLQISHHQNQMSNPGMIRLRPTNPSNNVSSLQLGNLECSSPGRIRVKNIRTQGIKNLNLYNPQLQSSQRVRMISLKNQRPPQLYVKPLGNEGIPRLKLFSVVAQKPQEPVISDMKPEEYSPSEAKEVVEPLQMQVEIPIIQHTDPRISPKEIKTELASTCTVQNVEPNLYSVGSQETVTVLGKVKKPQARRNTVGKFGMRRRRRTVVKPKKEIQSGILLEQPESQSTVLAPTRIIKRRRRKVPTLDGEIVTPRKSNRQRKLKSMESGGAIQIMPPGECLNDPTVPKSMSLVEPEFPSELPPPTRRKRKRKLESSFELSETVSNVTPPETCGDLSQNFLSLKESTSTPLDNTTGISELTVDLKSPVEPKSLVEPKYPSELPPPTRRKRKRKSESSIESNPVAQLNPPETSGEFTSDLKLPVVPKLLVESKYPSEIPPPTRRKRKLKLESSFVSQLVSNVTPPETCGDLSQNFAPLKESTSTALDNTTGISELAGDLKSPVVSKSLLEHKYPSELPPPTRRKRKPKSESSTVSKPVAQLTLPETFRECSSDLKSPAVPKISVKPVFSSELPPQARRERKRKLKSPFEFVSKLVSKVTPLETCGNLSQNLVQPKYPSELPPPTRRKRKRKFESEAVSNVTPAEKYGDLSPNFVPRKEIASTAPYNKTGISEMNRDLKSPVAPKSLIEPKYPSEIPPPTRRKRKRKLGSSFVSQPVSKVTAPETCRDLSQNLVSLKESTLIASVYAPGISELTSDLKSSPVPKSMSLVEPKIPFEVSSTKQIERNREQKSESLIGSEQVAQLIGPEKTEESLAVLNLPVAPKYTSLLQPEIQCDIKAPSSSNCIRESKSEQVAQLIRPERTEESLGVVKIPLAPKSTSLLQPEIQYDSKTPSPSNCNRESKSEQVAQLIGPEKTEKSLGVLKIPVATKSTLQQQPEIPYDTKTPSSSNYNRESKSESSFGSAPVAQKPSVIPQPEFPRPKCRIHERQEKLNSSIIRELLDELTPSEISGECLSDPQSPTINKSKLFVKRPNISRKYPPIRTTRHQPPQTQIPMPVFKAKPLAELPSSGEFEECSSCLNIPLLPVPVSQVSPKIHHELTTPKSVKCIEQRKSIESVTVAQPTPSEISQECAGDHKFPEVPKSMPVVEPEMTHDPTLQRVTKPTALERVTKGIQKDQNFMTPNKGSEFRKKVREFISYVTSADGRAPEKREVNILPAEPQKRNSSLLLKSSKLPKKPHSNLQSSLTLELPGSPRKENENFESPVEIMHSPTKTSKPNPKVQLPVQIEPVIQSQIEQPSPRKRGRPRRKKKIYVPTSKLVEQAGVQNLLEKQQIAKNLLKPHVHSSSSTENVIQGEDTLVSPKKPAPASKSILKRMLEGKTVEESRKDLVKLDRTVNKVERPIFTFDQPHQGLRLLTEMIPSARDEVARKEERDGIIQIHILSSSLDPKNNSTELEYRLLAVQKIIYYHLPDIPQAYVTRLLFDSKHKTLAIFKGHVAVGGICFRPFPRLNFSEVVFCAVNSTHQLKGYGTHMMNHLKDYNNKLNITNLLTFADNCAIEYFKKQGFSMEIGMKKKIYAGCIKEYDDATLMHTTIDPRIVHTSLIPIARKSKEVVNAELKNVEELKKIHNGLTCFKVGTDKIPLRSIPGIQNIRYNISNEIRNESMEVKNNSDLPNLSKHLKILLKDVKNHSNSWKLMNDLKEDILPCHAKNIKYPMDFATMYKRLESGYYSGKRLFIADMKRIFSNYRMYNQPDSKHYQHADYLESFFLSKIHLVGIMKK